MAQLERSLPLPPSTTRRQLNTFPEQPERAPRAGDCRPGLTLTTHKEGRLVREKMVEERVIERFKRVREEESERLCRRLPGLLARFTPG
jgi:hypothetical protein